MIYTHPYTLQELQLLHGASHPQHRPRPRYRPPARRRTAAWRQRVRGRLREQPQLTVFSVDAEEITAQLAHDGSC